MSSRTLLPILAAATVLAVAGCGSSDDDAVSGTGTTASTPTTATTAPAVTPANAVVTTNPGGTTQIVLTTNPGTGYHWEFLQLPSAAVATRAGSRYIAAADAEGRVGAGGVQVFTFKGVAAGTTKVTLGYVPPSGDKPTTQQSFTIKVS